MFVSKEITVQSVSLAVSVVLSILAISVLLPCFEAALVLFAYAQMSISNAHIDKLGSNFLSEPLFVCIMHMR